MVRRDPVIWLRLDAALMLLTLMLPTITGGCVTGTAVMQRTPTVRHVATRLANTSLEGADLLFDVEMHNPNPQPLPFTSASCTLANGGQPFLSATSRLAGTVPAGGVQTVTVTVPVVFEQVASALPGIRRGTTVRYQASLTLESAASAAGSVIVPVEAEGELPLPLAPRLELDDVQWQTLAADRAEAQLHVRVRNPNQFPIDLGEISSRVWLGGRAVAMIDQTDVGSLQPGAEATLDIAIAFVPDEVRLPVVQVVRGRREPYRFRGVCELNTSFGKMSLSFDDSGSTLFR